MIRHATSAEAARPPRPFPAEEFERRRLQVAARIGGDSVAVLQGAGPLTGFVPFRQNNETHYLAGDLVPQAYLALCGGTADVVVFAPKAALASAGAAAAAAGIIDVRPLEDLECLLRGRAVVYATHAPPEGRCQSRDVLMYAARHASLDPWDAAVPRQVRFVERLREANPGVEVRDLSPILDEMRTLKSPRELEFMRWAGRLSAEAVTQSMRCTRPGIREHHLAAVADYVFRSHGPRGEAYHHIIPSGANIWDAHYAAMDDCVVSGEMLLMDCAPDVGNYTSDIGRMWPVDGRYDDRQRELYGFIVEYHKAVLRNLWPGRMPQEVLDSAAAEMAPAVEGTHWSTLAREKAARACLTFRGHLSHPVGMAVHDVGSYFDKPLEVGLVIAVDPQMWVEEERTYVRVEDTVALVEGGIEVLTGHAPTDLADVEAIVGSGGIIQDYPPLNNHKETE